MELGERKVEITIGLFLLGGIIAWLVIPMSFQDTTIILTDKDGNAPTSCLPSGGLVLAQNLTDLCDVTIISPTTNQIIKYNGSQWVNVDQIFITTNATCSNLGSGTIVCASSSDNILYFKSLVALNGIQITNSSSEIFIENTGVLSVIAGSDISVNQTSGNVLITNTAPDNTICSNVGTGSNIYKDGECNFRSVLGSSDISVTQQTNTITIDFNGTAESTTAFNVGNGANVFKNQTGTILYFKTLLAGSDLSISNGTNTITITNTAPDNTVCANVGTGTIIYKDGECNFKTLVGSPDISITNTTNTVVIDYNGTHVTQVTSNNNNTIGVVPTTGNVVLYPKYQLLCQTTLGSSNSTISCNNFTAMKNLYVQYQFRSTGGTGIEPTLRFNGDSGTNYSFRTSTNGGADATGTNTSRCAILSSGSLIVSGNALEGDGILYNNQSGDRKLMIGSATNGIDVNDGTAPGRVETSCKWDNTSSQITSITALVFSGTGSFNTNSQLTVWGYD